MPRKDKDRNIYFMVYLIHLFFCFIMIFSGKLSMICSNCPKRILVFISSSFGQTIFSNQKGFFFLKCCAIRFKEKCLTNFLLIVINKGQEKWLALCLAHFILAIWKNWVAGIPRDLWGSDWLISTCLLIVAFQPWGRYTLFVKIDHKVLLRKISWDF